MGNFKPDPAELEKWNGILAEREADARRCRQQAEALNTIDDELKKAEVKVEILHNKLSGESPMIIDYALDLMGDVMKFNDFCAAALGIEIVLEPREPRPSSTDI